MRGALVITFVMLALTLPGGARQAPEEQSAEALLRTWTDAASRHEPGTLDDHANAVALWPWATARLAIREAQRRTPPDVLIRAGIMYLDIAVRVPVENRPAYPSGGYSLVVEDGRRGGRDGLDSQMVLARRLVNTVLDRDDVTPLQRQVALEWYRAASSVFFSNLAFADLDPHLMEALRRFPDDPRVLFDAGCASETFASPMFRAAIESYVPDELPRNTWTNRVPDRVDVPSASLRRPAEAHLTEAAAHFRRSLERDATPETRVRLGRVLSRLGRHKDALPHLEAAAAAARVDPVYRYFAHLFLGDALASLNRIEPALEAFRSAMAITPDAQSPRLAISRLEASRGNLTQARAVLAPLLAQRPVRPDEARDPWWLYERCSGIRVEAGIAALAKASEELAR